MSDTKSEATSAIVMVSANGRNSSPVMSLTRAIGRNTATVVAVDAVTAVATSLTAARIAVLFSSPSDRCRLMFSMTTIESSTTRPIAIVSAPRVSTFIVYPVASIPMKVTSTETGIEIAVTIVERTDSRNSRMTSTAAARPSSPSRARLSIDCSMNGA